MTYTHAKDYLFELANNPQTHGWLKDLIIKIVNNNGEFSEEDIEEATTNLISDAPSNLSVPTTSMVSNNVNVKFKSLTHHTGVAAIAKDQRINFSKDITLLYGNNGSGKSSYFRILNKIIGGSHRTEILPNIYSSTIEPINIELTYSIDGVDKSIVWDGKDKPIIPLNLSSVFDSSYVSTFLEKRIADTSIVSPYGLYLFTALTNAFGEIELRLKNRIENILNSLPDIESEGLSNDIKNMLSQKEFNEKQHSYVISQYSFDAAKQCELTKQEDYLKNIQETNFEDKLKIKDNELSQYQSLLNFLKQIDTDFRTLLNKAISIINKIQESRKKEGDVKHKIAILKEIGNTELEEWRNFIKAGDEFANKANLDPNICPYCRQPIIDNAVDILRAYSTYLSDQSSADLNAILNDKDILKQQILAVDTSYQISEQFKNLIEGTSCSIDIYSYLNDLFNQLNNVKSIILKSLDDENNQEFTFPTTLEVLIQAVSKICDDYEQSICELKEQMSKKQQLISETNEKIKPLVENKIICKQKDRFETWFANIEDVNKLKSLSSKLNTRNISTISKKASQTLITDNLKTKFQEELEYLGFKNIQVDLCDARAIHGQAYMQLKLVNNNSVQNILSEGEQKGVALALFIAERRMQCSKNPIILDDPVTSLDHFITAKLVDRLLCLDNQIIIFSHNLLLQTTLVNAKALHECCYNQYSSCKNNTKHLFSYFVSSHGRDSKGMISDMKLDKAKTYLDNAKALLGKKAFEYSDSISVGINLRHAIELIIDEKIFNNQIPVKFHGRKNSIQWDQLKSLNPDSTMIDKLKALFGRLSGGNLHAGAEQSYNPIDYEELCDIYNELFSIYNSK